MLILQMLAISIILPFITAGLCLINIPTLRTMLVVGTGVTISLASIFLVRGEAFSLTPESFLGIDPNALLAFLDFALLFVILGISYQLRNKLVAGLTLLQLVPLAFLEFFMKPEVEIGRASCRERV